MANHQNNSKGVTKEYVLLFLGALISLVTTLCVSLLNNRINEKNQLIKDRIAFTDELAKGMAKRFNALANIYNARLEKDSSEIKKWAKINESVDTMMDTRTYYYPSRLRVLFNNNYADEFHLKIDSPMDILEEVMIKKPIDSLKCFNVDTRWDILDSKMHKFVRSLYAEAFKNYKH